jgi:hypothetical protein
LAVCFDYLVFLALKIPLTTLFWLILGGSVTGESLMGSFSTPKKLLNIVYNPKTIHNLHKTPFSFSFPLHPSHLLPLPAHPPELFLSVWNYRSRASRISGVFAPTACLPRQRNRAEPLWFQSQGDGGKHSLDIQEIRIPINSLGIL